MKITRSCVFNLGTSLLTLAVIMVLGYNSSLGAIIDQTYIMRAGNAAGSFTLQFDASIAAFDQTSGIVKSKTHFNQPIGEVGFNYYPSTDILQIGGTVNQVIAFGTSPTTTGDFLLQITNATTNPTFSAFLYQAPGTTAVVPQSIGGVISATIDVWPGGPKSSDNKDTEIFASFAPIGLTLAQAATVLQYQDFNWSQEVIWDLHPPQDVNGNPLNPPYPDPPPGGYLGQPDTAYPYYWNSFDLSTGFCPSTSIPIRTSSVLMLCDIPREPSLAPGEFMEFITDLVGIDGGSAQNLFEFDWISDYTGGVGGVSTRGNTMGTLPGTGIGGVTILSVNGVPVSAVPEPSSLSALFVAIALFGAFLIVVRSGARRIIRCLVSF